MSVNALVSCARQRQRIGDQEVVARCAVVVLVPFGRQVRDVVAVLILEAAPLGRVPQRILQDLGAGCRAGCEVALVYERQRDAVLVRADARAGHVAIRRVEEVVRVAGGSGVRVTHFEVGAVLRRAGDHVAHVLDDAARRIFAT